MVSSCHYLATFAGTRMFERGGNAIDAGVAAGIALNVLERHLTDFGGVAPIIVFRPGMDAPETIDGLGHWPASLDLETYRATHGAGMPIGGAPTRAWPRATPSARGTSPNRSRPSCARPVARSTLKIFARNACASTRRSIRHTAASTCTRAVRGRRARSCR